MPAHVRFLLDAECSPGMLPRMLQPFAKRDLIPDRMWSHRSGDTMHVEIAVAAIPDAEIHLIEGNLRQIVGVRQVTQVRPEAHRPVTSWGMLEKRETRRERVGAMESVA